MARESELVKQIKAKIELTDGEIATLEAKIEGDTDLLGRLRGDRELLIELLVDMKPARKAKEPAKA